MKRNFLKWILFVATISLVTVIICEWKGDIWEEKVRTELYAISGDSVPAFSKEYVDVNGVPYVDYYKLNNVTAGKQYNATIVCNYAIDYYQQFKAGVKDADKKFFSCVSWLTRNVEFKENFAYYKFDWQQPWYDSVGNPYTSGMTSGLAIEVFTDAYIATKSPQFLQYARSLLRGYFIPIQQGGFTYATNDGWWYEELADTSMHTPRILDGHIFAITGVQHYYSLTKDDSAAIVINNGIQALKNKLPDYDIGNGWAFYDAYKKPADKKYQHILAGQMLQLYHSTRDTFFKNYYTKWNAPLSRPYVLRIIKERNRSGMVLFILVYAATIIIFLITVSVVTRIRSIRQHQ